MKKLLILGILCMFSLVNVQAAEAKDINKEFKNRPQIEQKKDLSEDLKQQILSAAEIFKSRWK